MQRNVILFRTHFISQSVIFEFEKIQRSRYDCFLLCDNTNNQISFSDKTGFSTITFNNKHYNAFLIGPGAIQSLELPLLPAEYANAPGRLFWYNGDYALYIFYNQAQGYEKYMLLDYDCFLNGDSYSNFAETNFLCNADFMCHNLKKT